MTSHNAGSSVLGWMSIACWIIVYSPQIFENYSLQSGEGLSVSFVVIWLLGDLSNLLGASMAGLLPTVILLAVYYTICDIVLLVQIYYYRWQSTNGKLGEAALDEPETDPLLGRDETNVDDGTVHTFKSKTGFDLLGRTALYTYAGLFVVLTGMAAYFFNRANQHEVPDSPAGGGHDEDILEWKSQVLGWTSALLYLGSRIPQIIKNAKTKCAGLSLGMFIFALGGNITYVLSILFESTSKRYLIANASWLAGSGLTIYLDFVVLYQFFHYRSLAGRVPPIASS
ncbi:hypothetical protein FRB94_008268 [Tulasnella sp. JGI-2019a]|nr:hypothetical protein FRB94_008268 [Tulasnella sp. JGI-2019a]KAG9010614.1 hypothetical protein FRB93_003882 [Tulasnella sp. JGI-2019a]KAG9030875.1 hypothetical protein FRB95_003438 [Tulasnella sp. JGI-2019a]